jgi:hypothetical protein
VGARRRLGDLPRPRPSQLSGPRASPTRRAATGELQAPPWRLLDLDELNLIPIEPLPSWVWYRDMADFAEGISDSRAGASLPRAIDGKGAVRRFKDRLHQSYPDLLPAWHAFQSVRAKRRAIEWLVDNSLVDQQAAAPVLARYADPDLP